MDTMVDSCVYLDVFTRDPKWYERSAAALSHAADFGRIVINPAIYAEISVRFERIEALENLLPQSIFDYRPIPREAAFLAGKCFLTYRRRGGAKSSTLPDFLIGAHASVENLPLVTRDARTFRTYFPHLRIVTP